MTDTNIFKGDNTQAFGGDFLTINLDNPSAFVISKASIRIGNILKTVDNPTFPLTINLDSSETEQLCAINDIFMALWDSSGRKMTVKGTIQFEASARVV